MDRTVRSQEGVLSSNGPDSHDDGGGRTFHVGLLRSLVQVVDILVEPSGTVSRVSSKGYNQSLILVVILVCAALVQMLEYRIVGSNLLAAIPPEKAQLLSSLMQSTAWTTIALSPLSFLLKTWVTAYLIWVASMFVSARISFAHLFSFVLIAQVVLILGKLVAIVVWHLNGSPTVYAVDPVGLNLLIPDGLVRVVAGLLNPFSAWFLMLLVFGVSKLGRVAPRLAALAVVPYAVGVVALAVANASALQSVGIH